MRYLKINVAKCNEGRPTCQYACKTACAEKVFKLKDPSRAALQIHEKRNGTVFISLCDQCGDCTVICPVDALQRNKLGVVILDKQLCVGCDNCTGICSKRVFMKSTGKATPHKCIACGVCVKACPCGALEIITA